MDHDQRVIVARASGVNRTSAEFFSRPALSRDEDCGIRWPHGLDRLEEAYHGSTMSNNFLRANNRSHGLTQSRVFFLGATVREGVVDCVRDIIWIKWLGHIIVGAVFQSGD